MKIKTDINRVIFYASGMTLEFYRYASMEATQVGFSSEQTGGIVKFSPLYENGEVSYVTPVMSSIETMFDMANITVRIQDKE